MEQGCVQLYYGDGKGKTTAAMGQIVRCVGHGFKVLVYQFLKGSESGEVNVISTLPGVEYIANKGEIPFLFNLTLEQQEHYRRVWQELFNEIIGKYYSGCYDLVVLDEVIDAYNLDLIDKNVLHEMMDKRPVGTELILTGHQSGQDISELIMRADYVTQFVKEKHPFDMGMPCRIGIEK